MYKKTEYKVSPNSEVVILTNESFYRFDILRNTETGKTYITYPGSKELERFCFGYNGKFPISQEIHIERREDKTE